MLFLRMSHLLVLSACLALAATLRAQTSGLDAPQPVAPFFNGTFPPTAPGQATGWTTENAFPNLTFIDPLWLTPVPGGNDLLLVGKNGQLWRFPNDPAATPAQVVKVLEWAAATQTDGDQGFYSLVFHPQFGQSGSPNANYTYVCYNHRPALAGADLDHSFWRVSRFTWQPATGTLDPASEWVLMQQYDPCSWHNGGAMFFDPQGFLNITCGDGGDSGAGGGLAGALSRTQRLDFGFFSGVFRIDVDHDPAKSHPIRRQPQNPAGKPAGWPNSFSQGYGIPNDNPWLDPAGSILEEYRSLGLRSPHTAHFDAATGDLWIGDVGEGGREEIGRLPVGGNAQWGYREGKINGPGSAASPPIGIDTPPDFDYDRSVGTCIIGGMRYRGAKWSALLGGRVLYGDHARGRIWAVTPSENGAAPVGGMIVDGFPTGGKVGLANFCTDAAGEIYLPNVNGTNQPGGTIRKLVVAGISTEPPQFLSQTGVFTDLATLATAPGVVPYDVANPLWSDAAAKQRWIILPNDGTHDSPAEDIVFNDEDSWSFPAGSVFVKHFEVATDAGDPAQVKRLETRFLVCTAGGGKYGVTYRWNAAGTDAQLLTTGQTEEFTVTLPDNSTATRRWDYPSRADCMLCHTAVAGQALGVQTASLNSSFHYPSTGRTANQLATFNALGMFDRTLTAADLANYIAARPLDDATAPVEHRVRSYLDMNCAHCHRPGGAVEAFDARLGTPLGAQGLINATLKGHFVMGPDARYLKPGDPSLSAIYVRLGNAGNGTAMPPLAKNLVDPAAVSLLEDYLLGLTDDEFQTTPSPEASYVRLTALSEVNGQPWTAVAEFSVLDGNGAPIPSAEMSVHAFDSEELTDEYSPASFAIDGNPDTIWHTEWGAYEAPAPHFLTIDLGSLRPVGGFAYTPRQDMTNGRIANYQVHYSVDGSNWSLLASGTWTNDPQVMRDVSQVGRRKARCEIAGPASPVAGDFDVTVVFDADVPDFTAADIQVNGGSVTALRGGGYYYVARISPSQPAVSIAVPTDAANLTGLGSRASNQLTVPFVPPPYQMAVEAESGVIDSGFIVAADPAASAGAWLWTPEGSIGGVDLNLSRKVGYQLQLPRTGLYHVRGLVRSDDQSSDSFFIGFDGSATPEVWHTNQLAGQVGSGQFHWDVANSSRDPLNAPLVFNLAAGSHSLEIYGRDDGTRIDRLELVPLRPFPSWAAPAVVTGATFSASLHFTEPVSGVEPADVAITGGTVISVTGFDADYTVVIAPSASQVVVSLAVNSVTDSAGEGNHASDPFTVIWRTPYESWVLANDVGSPSGDDDLDGIPNLLEYVLGGDPSEANPGLVPTASTDGGEFVLIFQRLDSSEDIALVVEAGDTLGTWPEVFTIGATSASSSSGVDIQENAADPDTITVTIPNSGASSKFARLRALVDQ